MYDLFINLLAQIIWAVLGVVGAVIYYIVLRILPKRRLWRLKNPKETIICISASTTTFTGEYYRRATGIGQLRALAVITPSLKTAYRNIKIENILLSDEQLGTKIENDLILLGGPKNNPATKLLLEKLKDICFIDQTDEYICWRYQAAENYYRATIESSKVKRDYGLIIRVKNPFSTKGSTVCLLSGGHTYGVIAAAIYFVNYYARVTNIRKLASTLIAVVSCDVVDDYPVNIRLEEERYSQE
jgi:hypothetical protein